MRIRFLHLVGAVGFSTLSALPGVAQDLTILVAPRGTLAFDTAEAAEATGDGVVAQRSLTRGLGMAADHLPGCGACVVEIRVAAGAYDGKARSGMWRFPEVDAPEATLIISGGWDDDFGARAPFDTPTILKSNETRGGPVLQFEGRKHAIGRLVVSGLVFDTMASNRYDADSRAILKGSSSTWPQISFGYLTTDHLVIADNVFMNGAAGVGAPSIRVLSDDSRIDVQNNIFFNDITPWTVPGGASDKMPAEIRFGGNSFVLNWPYNPDPTTSNPGALEIGNNYATRHVLIEGNLFTHNMGGAIFPQWDVDRGPPITIRENLFWENGLMFTPNDPESGAVVGKFAGSPRHGVFTTWELEDDFDWDVYDNEAFDPGFLLSVPELKAVRYGDDYRGADVAVAETGEAPEMAMDAELGDLAAQLAELTGGADGDTDDDGEGGGVVVLGPDNDIRNYAPALSFSEVGLPFPTNPDAEAFGASPLRIWMGF